MFVCPTNVLAQKNEENGITLNKFFSIGMTEDSKMAKFDDSPYDTIVFDEIFFYNIRNLTRIKTYCENNPEKIIIATGDTNQLETIDLEPVQLRRIHQLLHRLDLRESHAFQGEQEAEGQ